jgi:hypothetical protein
MAFALPDHGTNPTASTPVSALPHSYPRNFDFTDLVSAQCSVVNRGALTYLVASQDFLGPGPWLMPPSGRSLSFLCPQARIYAT